MGWRGVTVMDRKVRFIAECLNKFCPFNELCLQFSISRKTGYKWIKRYEEYEPEGLFDQSTRPRSCPHETDTDIVEAIVQVRMKHPTWGPKKLLAVLSIPGARSCNHAFLFPVLFTALLTVA